MKLHLVAVSEPCTRIRVEEEFPPNDGDLDLAEDPFIELMGPDLFHRRVMLDLSRIAMLGSPAIGWLIASHKKFQHAGGRLVLHSITPRVRQVMQLMNLDCLIPIAPDEEAARILLDAQKAGP